MTPIKQPQERDYLNDGIYTKEFILPQGSKTLQHVHKHSHTSILATGEVLLHINHDVIRRVKAPAVLYLGADDVHLIEALENSTWYCVWHTDIKDVTKVCESLIKK